MTQVKAQVVFVDHDGGIYSMWTFITREDGTMQAQHWGYRDNSADAILNVEKAAENVKKILHYATGEPVTYDGEVEFL